MMTSIPSVVFSSDLPSVIEFQAQDEVFTFSVEVDEVTIYRTSLFTNDDIAHFYDLDQMVTQYMLEHRKVKAMLYILAEYEGGEDRENGTVFFSAIRTDATNATAFLKANYLTTRTFFRMPRNAEATQNVEFFAYASEKPHKGNITAVVELDDGSVRSATIEHNLKSSTVGKIYNFTIGAQYIQEVLLEDAFPDQKFKLLEATVRHGQRALTLFFTDEQPIAVLSFANAFNIIETAYIYGSQTICTDVTTKSAMVQRQTSFYAREIDQRFKVETCPLSMEEALWFNQLLSSDYVSRDFAGKAQPVLIDDITSDIPTNTGEPIRMKFSYRYTTPEFRHKTIAQGNVFTSPFSSEFNI